MNYSLFLARRLSLSSGGRKASPAVRVAAAAVAVSVVVMMAAIAVVTGFKHQIISKIEGFNSDMTIVAAPSSQSEGSNIITLTPSLRELLDSRPYISDYSLQISAPAIIKTPEDFKGVYLKTLTGSHLRNMLSNSLEEGSLPAYAADPEKDWPDSVLNQVLISRIAASQLGLKAGEKIDVYFITDQVRVRRMLISGVFNSHLDSYDDVYIFGAPALLREIGKLSPSQGTALSVATSDFSRLEYDAADLQRSVMEALADGRIYRNLRVASLRDTGGNFFSWLQLLDMNVVVVLVLMTFVACVTLISGMLIVIVDKKRFIALMKALGMPARRLRRVFIYMSVRVTLVGLLIGDALALALLYLQKEMHLIPLDPESYYIDYVPVEMNWPLFALLNAGVLLVSYIVLILPARFVGSVSPSRVLSTE